MKRAFALILTATLWGSVLPSAGAGTGSPIYPPTRDVDGVSQPEWMGRYQIWLNEIPADTNPLFDPASSANCARQEGGVIFVGASGADCSIPGGLPVALSGAFLECSTAEGLGETYDELRRCAVRNFRRDFGPDSSFGFRFFVDGERVPHIRDWVFLTPGEIIDFPDDNIWGAVPGPSKSVTKGFQFILKPMAAGPHRVVAKGSSDQAGFRLAWNLHVRGYGS